MTSLDYRDAIGSYIISLAIRCYSAVVKAYGLLIAWCLLGFSSLDASSTISIFCVHGKAQKVVCEGSLL